MRQNVLRHSGRELRAAQGGRSGLIVERRNIENLDDWCSAASGAPQSQRRQPQQKQTWHSNYRMCSISPRDAGTSLSPWGTGPLTLQLHTRVLNGLHPQVDFISLVIRCCCKVGGRAAKTQFLIP